MLSGNLCLWHCINAPIAMMYLRGCLILTFRTGFLFRTYLINVMQMVMMMMVMVVWPAMGLVFLLLVFPALTSTFIRAVKAFTTADVLLLAPGGELQGPLMILFGIRCWTWYMNQKKRVRKTWYAYIVSRLRINLLIPINGITASMRLHMWHLCWWSGSGVGLPKVGF